MPFSQFAQSGGLIGLDIFLAFSMLCAVLSRVVGAFRGRKVEEVAFGFGDVFASTFLGLLTGWSLFMGAITLGLLDFAPFLLVYLGALLGTKLYRAFCNSLLLAQILVLGVVVMLVV